MSLTAAMRDRSITDVAAGASLGVSAEAVRLWRTGQRKLSAERAIEIEEKLHIPRHCSRPDLFPAPADEIVSAEDAA